MGFRRFCFREAVFPKKQETDSMKIKTLILGTIAGAGALVALAAPAAADIACNHDGDCWHTADHYNYDAGWGVTVHPNDWKWHDGDHYRWHEHDGRGYWRSGVWIGF
jgi:hypothetical protein